MNIVHLGFFNVTKGEHQGRYALLEFAMKNGKTKSSRSIYRVGVMVSDPVKVVTETPVSEWSFEDASAITADQLFKMVKAGKGKLQKRHHIILWTNKGPQYDPPAEMLPRWYQSRLVSRARNLLALPAASH
ncbi:MAG: hypothetical protein F4219_05730 [Gammaproteobacteria bacterium]|nr:hypothetical protein [Gammaproteobacteria bacterium]